MTDTNITMVKGDTLSFGMEFEGLDQDPLQLTSPAKWIILTKSMLFRRLLMTE